MTVVHTYFYIVVYTQRGCRTLKKITYIQRKCEKNVGLFLFNVLHLFNIICYMYIEQVCP